MNRQKAGGAVAAIVGIVVGVVSILADVLGITGDPNAFDLDTFGTRQIIGAVVGIIALVAGGGIYFFGERFMSRGHQAAPAEPTEDTE